MASAVPLELRSGPRSASPPRFPFTGSLYETAVYVEREADRELPRHLIQGDYCHVLAPRQMGKSSLRVRVARKLAAAGVRCASVDLTSVGTTSNPEDWYFGLVDELARRLRLEDPLDFWKANGHVLASRRWSDYLRRVLAGELAGQRVVVMLDEIEAVRTVPFPIDDFFTQIRSLYEARSSDPDCRRLTFCLIGVTTPNDLIRDKLITPFNVSHAIRLDDFSRTEMQVLAPELEELGADPDALLDVIHAWTDGHPYMTMRTCAALVAEGRIVLGDERGAVEAVVRRVFLDRPLEDPNLNYAARRFADPRHESRGVTLMDKVSFYQRVVERAEVPSEVESAVQMELRLSGMVKEIEQGGRRVVRLRNRIFSTVFNRDWLRSLGDRRFLSETVWKWLDAGKEHSGLLRGLQLANAVEWARTAILSEDEAEFLAASQREERDEVAKEVAATEKRGAAAKTTLRNIVFVMLGVVMAGAAVVAVLSARARSLGAEVEHSRLDLAMIRSSLAEATRSLAARQGELTQALKERDDALAQAKQANAEKAILATKVEAARTDASTAQAQLAWLEKDVVKTRATADAAVQSAAQVRSELESALRATAQARVDRDAAVQRAAEKDQLIRTLTVKVSSQQQHQPPHPPEQQPPHPQEQLP